MTIRRLFGHGDTSPGDETDAGLASRLRPGLATASDVSDRLRAAAGDGVDALEARVRRRLEERIRHEIEGALGPDPAEHEARTERRLRAFLRRYDLDGARLDDRTLARLRDRLAPPESPSVDELVDALVDADGVGEAAAGDGPFDRSSGGSHDLSAALDRLCREADVDADRALPAIAADLLDRDAVRVGHAAEAAADQVDLPDTGRASAPNPASLGFPGDAGDSVAGRSGLRVATLLAAALVASGADAPSGGNGWSEGPGGGVSSLRSLFDAVSGDGPDIGTVLSIIDRLVDGEGPDESPRNGDRSEADEADLSADAAGRDLRSLGVRALVGLFVANLAAMSVGAYLSRKHAPPIPEEIRGPEGEVLVTEADVTAGKKTFQANGLMNHGSVLGNGAYYGSDLTADALRAKVDHMRDYYARERGVDSFDGLDADARAAVSQRVEDELDAPADDGGEGVVRYSAAEAYAHRRIRETFVERYHGGDRAAGIPEGTVPDRDAAVRLADFACWTAWFSHARRPNGSHSYTNDWPYVPGSGNRPTEQVLGWSAVSLVLLIAGGGLGVWAYQSVDIAEPTTEAVSVPTPDAVSVTPTQYAAAWYVPVAGALFTAQVLSGALLAHYYIERDGFFGFAAALDVDVLDVLPFAVVRTWHVNLAILWVTTLWLAGGLFLPGLFDDEDPPRQATGAWVLLGALVATTLGAFAGVWLGIQGKLGSPEDGELWWLVGSEGLEYLETGRLWKVLLFGALTGWVGLAYRGARRVDKRPTGIAHFIVYAGGSIALLFAASMLYTPETTLAVTEFWRWWVVHMWVEGVFEFFVTAVTAVALVSMDLLEQSAAEKAIMFETFAIMGAGIVGVSHHYWWVGLPDFWVPIGTTFSTLEFVPLMFILQQSFEEYRTLDAQSASFPYRLPLTFLLASSVWNFVGAGVLGFFINVPAINYFEHGTYLTVAHSHAATFGAFGLLALGLGTYILRVVTPEDAWEPGWFRGAFWLTNVGIGVMTVCSLLPLGFAQLRSVYEEGYATARSPEFYERPENQRWLWARSLGDAPMILGALAFTVGAVRLLLAAGRDRRSEESAATGSNA